MTGFITSATKASEFPPSEKEIVFVGKSNVGKSSLINTLYKKGMAYVGKTPGKTKLINFFSVSDDYTICDVPGYGYAKRSDSELVEFGRMMESYFTKRDCLRLCVVILDCRRIPNEDDHDMIDYLKQLNIPYLIVLNKTDKLSNNELFNQKRKIMAELEVDETELVPISCIKRKNIDLLSERIEEYLV